MRDRVLRRPSTSANPAFISMQAKRTPKVAHSLSQKLVASRSRRCFLLKCALPAGSTSTAQPRHPPSGVSVAAYSWQITTQRNPDCVVGCLDASERLGTCQKYAFAIDMLEVTSMRWTMSTMHWHESCLLQHNAISYENVVEHRQSRCSHHERMLTHVVARCVHFVRRTSSQSTKVRNMASHHARPALHLPVIDSKHLRSDVGSDSRDTRDPSLLCKHTKLSRLLSSDVSIKLCERSVLGFAVLQNTQILAVDTKSELNTTAIHKTAIIAQYVGEDCSQMWQEARSRSFGLQRCDSDHSTAHDRQVRKQVPPHRSMD